MSHNGIYRAKYKKLPLGQRSVKSMVNTLVETNSHSSLSDTSDTSLKSHGKASAPHLTCYYKPDSEDNIVSSTTLSIPPSPNKYLIHASDKTVIPENDVTKSPEELPMTNNINIVKPRTDYVRKSSVETRYSKTEASTSARTENGKYNRKSILHRSMSIPNEKKGKEKKREIKLNNEISHCSQNSVFAEMEVEAKLNSISCKENKLKKSKSVKFNLKSEETTKAADTESVTELNPRQQVEERQVLAPPSSNQILNDPLQNYEQETTIGTFLNSFLSLSWPTDVNLNPIPAITRSSTGILVAAYDFGAHIVRTGLQIASSILSDGVEQPREDIVQYNGITIRTCGRELMLHSLYVNCHHQDVGHRGQNRRRSNSATSSNTSVNSCTSCNSIFNNYNYDAPNATGRNVYVRIVIEVTNLESSRRAEHFIDPTHDETRVICDGSSWTLIYGTTFESVVEIQLPNTIQAESLTMRPMDGIIRVLVIDIP